MAPTSLLAREDVSAQLFAAFREGGTYRDGLWLHAHTDGDKRRWFATPIGLQASNEFREAMLRAMGPDFLRFMLKVSDRLGLGLDRSILLREIEHAAALRVAP